MIERVGIETHPSYLFVFAHPDDEVYTAGLLHRMVEAGKPVTAAFVTDGDDGANAGQRVDELAASMDIIGISPENVRRYEFSERTVLGSLSAISDSLAETMEEKRPSAIVGMDFEGGHAVHDAASAVTTLLARANEIPHYTFPVYHVSGKQRRAAMFLPGREATDVVEMTEQETELKVRVMQAHAGQISHFAKLAAADPEYINRLRDREVYREIVGPVDFLTRPAQELGYDRSGYSFSHFQEAILDLIG